MSYPVIAHTRYDGPVVLRTCATQDEQRRFFREAVADWQTGGYDDVERIEMGSVGPGPAHPETTVRTQARLKGL